MASSPVKKWRPPASEWLEVFAAVTADLEGATQRPMFGYPALFVNGNMFACLHAVGLVLRLPANERERFFRLAGSRAFEPEPGHVMREYVVAPAPLAAKPAQVEAWLRKSLAFASSLPPKTPRRQTAK